MSLSNVSYLDPRLSTAESGVLFASYRPVVVYPCQVTCKRPAQDPIAAIRAVFDLLFPIRLRSSFATASNCSSSFIREVRLIATTFHRVPSAGHSRTSIARAHPRLLRQDATSPCSKPVPRNVERNL